MEKQIRGREGGGGNERRRGGRGDGYMYLDSEGGGERKLVKKYAG